VDRPVADRVELDGPDNAPFRGAVRDAQVNHMGLGSEHQRIEVDLFNLNGNVLLPA
jgi:hypothetical protein